LVVTMLSVVLLPDHVIITSSYSIHPETSPGQVLTRAP
jgi:hypothetical protein